MAGIAINDLSSTPWVIAEEGVVTTKNCKYRSITHHEADDESHVVELVNKDGHLVARFDAQNRTLKDVGWMNGLTVERMDSGYLLAYFDN